ncbi:MAG TPA: C25 family cysteine peptidase [Bacteroidales bacterium]|nr:C25 family cysteine peptidase [Bacteroidales bacterium]
MKRILLLTGSAGLLILLPVILQAEILRLNSGKNRMAITENTYRNLVISVSLAEVGSTAINTPAGMFTLLDIEGFGRRNKEGEPALPVYRKLVEVPVNAGFTVKIRKQHYIDFDLAGAGVKYPVFPAQPPMSKGEDPAGKPFFYLKEKYAASGWIADDLATVTFVGTLRALNLARIDLSPVQYDPVANKLRVYDQLEVEILFEHPDVAATLALKASKASPFFTGMYRMVGNFKSPPPTDELIASAPVTYVIVSDPMFQSALQPFIAWKKKKGFRVIEGYTSNPAVGTTTTSIKAWLQGLYTAPPSGYNAPSFVLLVGDVAQIPAWAGGAGSHYTDLRYCEYTNDNLPEVYYGRFSATSVAELQPQIDKTLEYEQYTMPDPSFLNEAVMSAGADASYQTWSNGQINYGTENYFNTAHGITSHTYLQPEPSGGNYSQNIRNNISAGVAYANYTAHCSSSGWANPSFQISDIASLTNAHKYCLMVGNCCLSCKFDVQSFAEEQLRAVNKGAVGYIGGSNNTYWDEDYWWGCGFKTVVLHPAYDAVHIGAYDGTFHDHAEPVADWFVTQGQMVVCGDYAVEESGSSLKQYYWEIYHLMGDPSLMAYYSVPPAMTASYASPLMIGMSSLQVNTEPYAYVALSMGGELIDAKLADAAGSATLSFPALSAPGIADIVVTKQNRQPYISTIQVIPASGPYVVHTDHGISDPLPGGNNNGEMDFGEQIGLNVTLKNVGIATATAVTATLSSAGGQVTLTDNTENAGDIPAGQSVTLNNAFALTVAGNIPDQTVVPFTLQCVSGTNSWSSGFNITANAPVLQAGALTVLDNGTGCDNDGILDPGETADIMILAGNTGHASVGNAVGTLTITTGASPYLTILSGTSAIGTLAAGGTGNAVFHVTAAADTPIGTAVDLTFALSAGSTGQYSITAPKQVVIGLIPTYIMSTSTVSTCAGNFFDPGGETGDYTNSLDYTMTFHPGTTGSLVRVVFSSFELESQTSCGYDYLKIYDGPGTSSTLLGTWCGTNSPGTILSSHASGALTFMFHSDVSVTKPGWAASVSCLSSAVANPASFTAIAAGASQIDLAWAPNASNHNVMAVYSVNGVFGTPVSGTIYTAGATITGGGTVLCTCAANAYSHTGLNPGKTYYYKAFSYDASHNYSTGLSAQAVTPCEVISTLPWTEGFENGGNIPVCWSQQEVNSSGVNWAFIAGNGGSYPATSHGGTYNACLKDNSSSDNKTLLISPAVNLAGLPSPQLKFWHTQALWSPDQDLLVVYYRKSATDPWTQLASYTANISSWTQETLSLPDATATYSIAFEGNAKYGYGVCLDDIEISSSCSIINTVGISIAASANPVTTGTPVTFTATPENGGTTPVYQWKVNAGNAIDATNATYSYVPANGDAVTCQLVSNQECVTGNPALSTPVVMTVTSAPQAIILQDVTIDGTECYDATGTITLAGNGHAVTVIDGGNMVLIAGLNILLLPGTSVQTGGFLSGTIAPYGPFCPTQSRMGGLAATGESENGRTSAFRVYPNPTSGRITVDPGTPEANFQVEIYNMQGRKIFRQEFPGKQPAGLSLGGNPAGIYLVRITRANRTETVRVIKLY